MFHDSLVFTASLAGIPVQITCRHEDNKAFLKDYLTGEAPLFQVEPTAADLERTRRGFMGTDGSGAPNSLRFSDAFLENNAIHALIAEELTAHHVLLFHGSALCMDGDAYIFTAPSGTGKSTHARLWREAFGDRVWMINDDKPLLRIEDGLARVYGSPWDGKHRLSRNASAPLKAILQIVRSDENHVERMSQTDAFQLLLQQGYTSKAPETTRRILAMEMELLDSVAFYRLYCNMEPDAAICAWKGIRDSS